jgi:low temperature requirement protein LtrA
VNRIGVELRDGESVGPLELFFDLVFALGIAQCTALMVAQPTWPGIGRGILMLAVLWWAWLLEAWLTSVVNPGGGRGSFVMFAAMAALLVVALSTPRGFGDRAMLFAVAYGLVRLGDLPLYVIAGRNRPGVRPAVIRSAVSTALVVGLLVAASFGTGVGQALLWVVAVAVDWGVALLGHPQWRAGPRPFRRATQPRRPHRPRRVDRGPGHRSKTSTSPPRVVATAVLGVGLAAALWWIYFDVVAIVMARRLAEAPEGHPRIALARDSYSYLHFPMVAGIVLVALGLREALHSVDKPLDAVAAFGLLGGTAIYSSPTKRSAFVTRTLDGRRLAVAALLLAFNAAAVRVEAPITLVTINALLWATIAHETVLHLHIRFCR